jgi:hypothetical protein
MLSRGGKPTSFDRDTLAVPTMAVLLLVCLAGVIWTAYSWWRFGLGFRPRLSSVQTAVRFLIIFISLVLLRLRTNLTERIALGCAVIAAGSSALNGLGMSSHLLQFIRLFFHLLAYAIGAIAIFRWFRSEPITADSSAEVPQSPAEPG